MDDEPTDGQLAASSDNRQQAALDAVREFLAPLVEPPKRGRGRPRKTTVAGAAPAPKRPPGRPRKDAARVLELVPDHLSFASRGGPATDAGKDAVRLNAVRHGLRAAQVPIPGIEDPDEWEAFRDAMVDDCAPVGAREEEAAGRIAEYAWRRGRVAAQEAQIIATNMERVEVDYRKTHGYSSPGSTRQAEEAVAATQEAIEFLCNTTADAADPTRALTESAAFDFADALDDLGASAGILTIGDEDGGWSGALMRTAVIQLAQESCSSVASVTEGVLSFLNGRLQRHEQNLAETIAEQDRMHRERRLPPADQILILIKYEAHFARQLAQANNDLETLQNRRLGAPTPINRVHFSVGG